MLPFLEHYKDSTTFLCNDYKWFSNNKRLPKRPTKLLVMTIINLNRHNFFLFRLGNFIHFGNVFIRQFLDGFLQIKGIIFR